MKHQAIGSSAISIPPSEQLVRPQTPGAVEECWNVSSAIHRMRSITASLFDPLDQNPPIVWFSYSGAPAPQAYWARHLWIQITIFDEGQWLGRISHIVPEKTQFLIAPVPNSLQDHLAREAVQHRSCIKHIKLCTIYGPDKTVHCINFRHPTAIYH